MKTDKMKQFFFIIFLFAHLGLMGQQVMIDRGIRAAGLWCFPLQTDSTSYYYLPQEASLALDKDKNPEFSLIRYVVTEAENTAAGNSIQKAGGGAILNFLVKYDTPESSIKKAEEKLKEVTGLEKAEIKGVVIFEKGNYALVSSVLTKDGKQKNMLMASGSAPVLEGSKIALSFELKPETSKLLLESFKMATPDISIVFDMEFSGVSDAFDAEMTVDWAKVQQSEHIKTGAKLYFVSADIDKLYKNLQTESAISLITNGEDSNMQALIDRMYEKLTDLFFKEIDKTEVPETIREDMVSGMEKVIKKFTESSPISAHGAYAMRDLRTTGYSKLNFNSRSTVRRHHYILFNMGDLYQKYAGNTRYFRTISLDDPDFQQRVIHVGVDGILIDEMGQMINNVTVTLRKEHENGEQTLQEILVTPETLKNDKPTLQMVYGSKTDTDRIKWMNYQYRTNWKFSGGGTFKTDWQDESASMINLFSPFRRTRVQLFGDPNTLTEAGVRAVIVQLLYPFFGETQTARLVWKPGENIDEKTVDLTLPVNSQTYTYKITWVKSDGSRTGKEGKDNSGLIFIDEL